MKIWAANIEGEMESFMSMMHLRRYQGVADDGSTINGTGLSKVGFVLFCVWLFVFIFCFYKVVIKVRYFGYKKT